MIVWAKWLRRLSLHGSRLFFADSQQKTPDSSYYSLSLVANWCDFAWSLPFAAGSTALRRRFIVPISFSIAYSVVILVPFSASCKSKRCRGLARSECDPLHPTALSPKFAPRCCTGAKAVSTGSCSRGQQNAEDWNWPWIPSRWNRRVACPRSSAACCRRWRSGLHPSAGSKTPKSTEY